MSNALVKTTVTIPEDIIRQAKLVALSENTTLSDLIRSALEDKVKPHKKKKLKDPMKLAGTFTMGIDKLYSKRSDLYDDRLKRKMGF